MSVAYSCGMTTYTGNSLSSNMVLYKLNNRQQIRSFGFQTTELLLTKCCYMAGTDQIKGRRAPWPPSRMRRQKAGVVSTKNFRKREAAKRAKRIRKNGIDRCR
ncbi:hypothetical protein B296_00047085 [Ensete ventricosum]|uniref:Uncharacterized protein n=1 Tax=Ensete ventricosum TaxID=4639 RepID=A0A426Z147_ENSVE|nr:hypothetical protein B296_00047085 [Ensete ventricosum]